MSDTVTPPWILTRVRQIDSDTGSLSLTLDGESTPKVEVSADGRTTFNTSLAVTGHVILEAPVAALSGVAVTGAVKASGSIEAEQGLVGLGSVPVGAILMWSGDPAKLPEGWHLCNGSGWLTNGDPVPDLRGRFIVSHDPANEDYKLVNNRSEAATRALQLASPPKEEVLQHAPVIAARLINDGDTHGLSPSIERDAEVGLKGASETLDVRPPWYALAYIIYGGRDSHIPADASAQAVLRRGDALTRGGSVVSASGRYSLRLDSAGKLALYDDGDRQKPTELWTAKKDGLTALGTKARYQTDGNFVLYSASGGPLFASDTYLQKGVLLRVTDEGKVTIDKADGQSIWSKP